jgi:uncharacterized membrane protein YesL
MLGIFGFLDYSKPGKGVYKNQPQRSRFAFFWVLFQRKFWVLIQLNLLYLIFCLPVVTIGPATAAMSYILRQFVNERPVFLLSDFWEQFCQNWKQSLAFSVIQALFIAVMAVSFQYYYYSALEHTWVFAVLGLCFVIILLSVFASFYIYLMIVTLDLKLSAIIKNAFIFAILGLKTNFITLFFVIVSFSPLIFFPFTIMLPLLLNLSLAGFIICYNSFPKIQQYAIEPYLRSLREEAGQNEDEEEAAESVFSDERD